MDQCAAVEEWPALVKLHFYLCERKLLKFCGFAIYQSADFFFLICWSPKLAQVFY